MRFAAHGDALGARGLEHLKAGEVSAALKDIGDARRARPDGRSDAEVCRDLREKTAGARVSGSQIGIEVLSVDRLYAGVTVQPMSADDLRHCDCEVLLDRTYYAPLSDPTWSDETRLEFEYMDDSVQTGAR